MDIVINAFAMLGIIVLAIMIGFLIGRNERKVLQQDDEQQTEEESLKMMPEKNLVIGKKHKNNGSFHISKKCIVSPVEGNVQFLNESGRKGAMIEPKQGQIYAPMSGKIVKLYPMGSAFVIRSDDKVKPQMEVLIRVGRQSPDELCSMYYRSHIIQNEVVNKGKLLLSFDMERLQAAGEEVAVTVSLEEGLLEGEVMITQNERVKVGEELIYIG